MSTRSWIHLTAMMSGGAPSLVREDTGAWLWTHLRGAFPQTIAAMLMPDHPHLVLDTDDPDRERRRLARLLGQFGRHFGLRGQAAIVEDPQPLRAGQKLDMVVRYVALNPCRKRLVRCPLAWPWSTHRDVVGATVDPWVDAERLARALGEPLEDFAQRHHAWVSNDSWAEIGGTPFPVAAPTQTMPSIDLRTIAQACVAALRQPLAAIRRHGPARALFVALAVDQGWDHVAKLAGICACSTRTIERLAEHAHSIALAAARLCLGDERLRRPATPGSLRSPGPDRPSLGLDRRPSG